jgi:hypothetical protein
MSITRRKFIQASAISLLAAGVPLGSAGLVLGQDLGRTLPGDIPYASQLEPVFTFNQSTFAPYLNTIFRVQSDAGWRTSLTLLEVREFQVGPTKDSSGQLKGECFSLFFTGGKKALPQENYTVTHDALGTFKLLIVPIVSRGRPIYQAVINHSQG